TAAVFFDDQAARQDPPPAAPFIRRAVFHFEGGRALLDELLKAVGHLIGLLRVQSVQPGTPLVHAGLGDEIAAAHMHALEADALGRDVGNPDADLGAADGLGPVIERLA